MNPVYIQISVCVLLNFVSKYPGPLFASLARWFSSLSSFAEADERKRIAAMRYKRSIAAFTPDETARFDHMQEERCLQNLVGW
jgi:hypothetical protein